MDTIRSVIDPNGTLVPRALTYARGNQGWVSGGLGLTVDLAQLNTPITVHFYSLSRDSRWEVRLWHLLGLPMYVHCAVEVAGCILFDQPLRRPGAWYESSSHLRSRPPAASIVLPVSVSPEDVERAGLLVEGRRTNRVFSAAHVLLGWPRRPVNCATSSSLLLWILGIWAPATTPDQLWSAILASKVEGTRVQV